MLTIKQKKLLDYIKSYYRDKDLFPTFDEMKDNLSIKSKSGIYKLLSSLEDKGFIRKTPHKARAIELNDFTKNSIETNQTNLPFLFSSLQAKKNDDFNFYILGFYSKIVLIFFMINSVEGFFSFNFLIT